MIVQVDRIASVEEAVALRDAGATLIGVALDPNPLIEDDRFVSFETARAIRDAIAPAGLVGLASCFHSDGVAQSRTRLERVLALEPDFVQFHRGDVLDEFVPPVLAAGVPVIDDGWDVCADHGIFIDPADPASFIRDQLSRPGPLRPALYHLDVVSDRENPWRFLVEDAPEVPDEFLQAADIAATTRGVPLLLSLMGLGAEEIGPYTRAFPDARGFFARLGPDNEWGGPRSTKPEPLLATLRALHSSQGREGIGPQPRGTS